VAVAKNNEAVSEKAQPLLAKLIICGKLNEAKDTGNQHSQSIALA